MRSFAHPFLTTTHTHQHSSSHKKNTSHSDAELNPIRGDDLGLLPMDATIQAHIEHRFKADLVHFVVFTEKESDKSWRLFKKTFIRIPIPLQKKVQYINELLDFGWYNRDKLNELIENLPTCCANLDELIKIVLPCFFSYRCRAGIQTQADFANAIAERFFEKMTHRGFSKLLSHSVNQTSMQDVFLEVIGESKVFAEVFAEHLFKKINALLEEGKYTDFKTIWVILDRYTQNIRYIQDKRYTSPYELIIPTPGHNACDPVIAILGHLIDKGQDALGVLKLFSAYMRNLDDVQPQYIKFLINFPKSDDNKALIETELKDILNKFFRQEEREKRLSLTPLPPEQREIIAKEWQKIIYKLAKDGLLPEEFQQDNRVGDFVFKFISRMAQSDQSKILHSIQNHDDIPLNRVFWPKFSPALFDNKKPALPKYWKKQIDSLLDSQTVASRAKQALGPKQ